MASHKGSFPELLQEYLAFLQDHRGLSDSALYVHRRWGEEFLRFLVKRLPGANLDALTVPIIDEFVQPCIRSAGRGTQSQVIRTTILLPALDCG